MRCYRSIVKFQGLVQLHRVQLGLAREKDWGRGPRGPWASYEDYLKDSHVFLRLLPAALGTPHALMHSRSLRPRVCKIKASETD